VAASRRRHDPQVSDHTSSLETTVRFARKRIASSAGGTCGSSSCWKALSSGFRYRNNAGRLRSIVSTAGVGGKAKITLKGGGAALVAAPLPGPFAAPATAVLRVGGRCFATTFQMPRVDDGMQYKANDGS
jgi:hypothetical protein